MCPDRLRRPDRLKCSPRHAARIHAARIHAARLRGFSLPMALFILVVLGALTTVMYRVLAVGEAAVVQDVLNTRALMAAESGAHLAITRLYPPSAAAGGASFTWTFADGSLQGCSTSVSSSGQTSNSIALTTVTSVGQCSAGPARARRTVTVQTRAITP